VGVWGEKRHKKLLKEKFLRKHKQKKNKKIIKKRKGQEIVDGRREENHVQT
jgi:hypothetical protein